MVCLVGVEPGGVKTFEYRLKLCPVFIFSEQIGRREAQRIALIFRCCFGLAEIQLSRSQRIALVDESLCGGGRAADGVRWRTLWRTGARQEAQKNDKQ